MSTEWRAPSCWQCLSAFVAVSLLCLMVLPLAAMAQGGWKVRDSAGRLAATVRITDSEEGAGLVSRNGTVYAAVERRRAGLWFMTGPTGYYHAFVRYYRSAPHWRMYGDDKTVFGRAVRRDHRQRVEERVYGQWRLWGTTSASCPAWLAAVGAWGACSQPGP